MACDGGRVMHAAVCWQGDTLQHYWSQWHNGIIRSLDCVHTCSHANSVSWEVLSLDEFELFLCKSEINCFCNVRIRFQGMMTSAV